MKEKIYNILLVVSAVLLAVSIFFNGWLSRQYFSGQEVPTSGILDWW